MKMTGNDRGSRMTAAQVATLGVCLAMAVLDGFDAQTLAYAAPSITTEFGFSPGALGIVFSASLVGMALGSVLFGMLVDRLGRKTGLIASVVIFGLATLTIPALATSVETFLLIRFIAGIGMGGVAPSFIALVSENVPAHVRSRAVMVAVGCVSLGAFLGGLVSRVAIPAYGWRSIFIIGGLLPLVFAVLAAVVIRGVTTRPQRTVDHASTSPAVLFRDGRATSTIALWLVYFLNLLVMFALLNWLPTLLVQAGLDAGTAFLGSSLFAAGGFIGGILLGFRIDRRGQAHATLVGGYLIGMVGIGLVLLTTNTPLLMTGILLIGVGIVGGQSGLTILAVSLYPLPIRGTGIGWAYAVGRTGSIAGPALNGVLVAGGLGATSIIGLSALPLILVALGVITLAALRSPATADAELAVS